MILRIGAELRILGQNYLSRRRVSEAHAMGFAIDDGVRSDVLYMLFRARVRPDPWCSWTRSRGRRSSHFVSPLDPP